MTKPSSFATLCTSNCAFELTGLLLSLSVYHTNETIYIMSDTKTKTIIDSITPKPKLNMIWFIQLDEYDGMNRQIMEDKKIWSDFQMSKAKIIKYALEKENDTLFLDCDIIITNNSSIPLPPSPVRPPLKALGRLERSAQPTGRRMQKAARAGVPSVL